MYCRLQVIIIANLLALCTIASLAIPDDTPEPVAEIGHWAEIAGLMVTLSNGSSEGEGTARYVVVANEYHRDVLIRQSVVVREHDSTKDMRSGLVSHCQHKRQMTQSSIHHQGLLFKK